ncbi:MAG: D-alanyl-D-alanine carboxypeptidase family protein [Actinomycetota bacterium]
MPREAFRPRCKDRLKAIAGATAIAVLVATAAPASGAVPPPTPVPPHGSPSPFPRTLETPQAETRTPKLDAPTALLADLDTGQTLFAKRAQLRRPIASVTKIMTALLVLERSEPGQVVTVGRYPLPGTPGLSALGLKPGEKITVGNLLYALLLQSANDAAVVLADHVGGSQRGFMKDMNDRARALGLSRTRFFSPNGLDDRGYSTVADLAVLTREALEQPRFSEVVRTKFHTIPSKGPARRVQNRNVLLWLYPGTTGVKTGYTNQARYCLVASAERGDRRLVAVILGSTKQPFSEAAELLNYGFEAFERRALVAEGEDLGERLVGSTPVEIAAAEGLEVLVPGRAGDVRRRIDIDQRAAASSPVAGDEVGTLVVSVPGQRLGEVPLVVSRMVALGAPPEGDWWSRALRAVGGSFSDALGGVFG